MLSARGALDTQQCRRGNHSLMDSCTREYQQQQSCPLNQDWEHIRLAVPGRDMRAGGTWRAAVQRKHVAKTALLNKQKMCPARSEGILGNYMHSVTPSRPMALGRSWRSGLGGAGSRPRRFSASASVALSPV